MKRLLTFLRIYVWFSFRHLAKHRWRAAAVLVGIALGASVFTSVRLSVDASLQSFTRSMDLFAGKADLTVARPGGRVPDALVASLIRHPAVSAATPVMRSYVRVSGDPTAYFLLIGIDPINDRTFRQWSLSGVPEDLRNQWLALIRDPATLVVGEALARRHGWHPGSRVRLETARTDAAFTVLGVLDTTGMAGIEGGRLAITDIATFQEFTGAEGVDRIDLILTPGDRSMGKAAIGNILPTGVTAGAPSAEKATGQAMIRAYQINLSILSFASLFVGMFLVYSLVALNAASRRKELAILRSVGGGRGLLFALFVTEGAVFGIAGWVVAIPVSAVLVRYMMAGVGQTISTLFVRVQVDQLVLSGSELALSLVLTVAVAMAAAAQPAREAMKVAPREVMAVTTEAVDNRRQPVLLALWGLVCVAAVIPLSLLPGIGGVPLPGYGATILLFFGFALFSPLGLRSLGRWASRRLRPAGVPAILAGRYVRTSGVRTAVSVGALITAVALFTSLVIMIHSFRRTVARWVDQTISGDVFVAPRLAEINGFRDPMSPDLVRSLSGLKTPAVMVRSRRFTLNRNGFPYQLEAMDMDAFMRHGSWVWYRGESDTSKQALIRGEGVIVSEVFANRTGLGLGDRFRAMVASKAVDLPILGVIRDYRTRGGIVFADYQMMLKRFPDMGLTGARFFVTADGADRGTAVHRLEQELIRAAGDRLGMVSGSELRGSVLRVFDETFAVTTVLLLIALVIAALGIATTLTVLVLERRQQLNTLLAVGASRQQIRSMILWEAAMLVAAGETAGLLCGFLLSVLLIFVINRQSFGWTFVYGVDWPALALSVPMIVATALVAAIPALGSVFRLPPATLLRERSLT